MGGPGQVLEWVLLFEVAELCVSGCGRKWISRKRAGLVYGPGRRHLLHEVATPPEGADGQPSPDDFAQRREIGLDPVALLCAPGGYPKTGHDFIEDQKRPVPLGYGAKALQKAVHR